MFSNTPVLTYKAIATANTKQWMSFRDNALSRAVQTQSESDWLNYRKLRNKVNSINKTEKKNWQSLKLKGAMTDPSLTWKMVKSWLGWRSGGPPTQLHVNGTIIQKPYDLAQTMNDYFIDKVKNICARLPQSNFDPLEILRTSMKNRMCSMKLSVVHPDDIDKIISELKSSKSCGLDDIDSYIIKLARKQLVPAITHIVNLSIQQQTFPKIWKNAKVIQLHKKGDITAPKNYRPVALLAVLSKILERAIFKQITKYMDNNRLFHPSHHGFRSNHNTTTAVLEMAEMWTEALDDKRISAAVMLDLSAAFDIVDTDILMKKLKLYGFLGG